MWRSGRQNRRGAVRTEYVIAGGISAVLLLGTASVVINHSARVAFRKPVASAVKAGTASPTAQTPARDENNPQPKSQQRSAQPAPTPTPKSGNNEVVVVETPEPQPTTPQPAAGANDAVTVEVTPEPATPAKPNDAVEVVAVNESPTMPAASNGAVEVVDVDAGNSAGAANFANIKVGARPAGDDWSMSNAGVSVQQFAGNPEKILRLTDISRSAEVWVKQTFPPESGRVIWSCRVRFAQVGGGFSVGLFDADKRAVHLSTEGAQIGFEKSGGGWQALEKVDANTWYNIRIDANVKSGTYTVFLNNKQVGEANLKFAQGVERISSWAASTPALGTGTMYIGNISLSH